MSPLLHLQINDSIDAVPLYESSKSIDEDDLGDIPPPKERKPKEVKNWKLTCEHANPDNAKFSLQQENTWSILKRIETADGMKWY